MFDPNRHFLLMSLLAATATLPLTGRALATQTKGLALLGVNSVKVRYKDDATGTGSNDRTLAVGRVKAEFSRFGVKRDLIFFDMRDKYDFFGEIDTEDALLKDKNVFQLRSLAYQRPYESSTAFFTLGRFPLNEADILVNDGAMAGYRLTDCFRLGVFGGRKPADIVDPLLLDDENGPSKAKAPQGGAFVGYSSPENATGTYVDAVASIAQVPDLDQTSLMYLHNTNTIHFNTQHFIFNYLRADLGPEHSLRRALLSYNYWNDPVRASIAFLRNDPTRQSLFFEAQNSLLPSVTEGVKGQLKYQLTRVVALSSQVSYMMRALDHLTRREIQAGTHFQSRKETGYSLAIYAGNRTNYTSNDTYGRLDAGIDRGSWSTTASQYVATEKFHDGSHHIAYVTDCDVGRIFAHSLRVAAGARYMANGEVTIESALLHVAYVFGEKSSI